MVDPWYKIRAWKIKIIAFILLAVGLGFTGFYMKIYRMFNGDYSDLNVPTGTESLGTLFVFVSPILWRLAGLL